MREIRRVRLIERTFDNEIFRVDFVVSVLEFCWKRLSVLVFMGVGLLFRITAQFLVSPA